MLKVHTNEIPLRRDWSTTKRSSNTDFMFEAQQGYASKEFGGVELCTAMYNAQNMRRLYLQQI